MLEYNSASGMYEATVDGKLVQVHNDEFSEVEAVHLQDALDAGMSQEDAEKKAFEEASWAGGWLNSHAVVQ